MPDPVTGLVVGGTSLLGGYSASRAQSKAASAASGAEVAATQMSVDEQKRQFNAIQKLLSPWVKGGAAANWEMRDLIGINGEQAQRQSVGQLATSPLFSQLVKQGENSLLQNAAATGGLRGGNLAGALAQYRPQMLNQQIQQQFANLGTLSSFGQSAAAGVGNAGMNAANNISNAYTNMGQSQAANYMAQGQAKANLAMMPANLLATYVGAGGGF